ncbi:MAG: PqqD family protein [Gammaproteobacteria bacterium]|nr:PqqD family protein [Gammaproteobacteria bacterium]
MLQADTRYRRTPGIVQRELDGSVFLVDAQSQTVFYLNELGSAIWQMVAEPVTEEDVIETVHQAFPDVSRQQVTEDVSGILREMLSRSLIVSAT